MADINIQMKNKIGETWNKLFPKTKIGLVEGLPAKLDDVDTRLNAAATKTEVNAKIGVVNEQLAETTGQLRGLNVNIMYPPAPLLPCVGGGADDTARFQSILDYVGAAGGGRVFVPQGDFMLSSTTYVKYSNLTIECAENSRFLLNGTGKIFFWSNPTEVIPYTNPNAQDYNNLPPFADLLYFDPVEYGGSSYRINNAGIRNATFHKISGDPCCLLFFKCDNGFASNVKITYENPNPNKGNGVENAFKFYYCSNFDVDTVSIANNFDLIFGMFVYWSYDMRFRNIKVGNTSQRAIELKHLVLCTLDTPSTIATVTNNDLVGINIGYGSHMVNITNGYLENYSIRLGSSTEFEYSTEVHVNNMTLVRGAFDLQNLKKFSVKNIKVILENRFSQLQPFVITAQPKYVFADTVANDSSHIANSTYFTYDHEYDYKQLIDYGGVNHYRYYTYLQQPMLEDGKIENITVEVKKVLGGVSTNFYSFFVQGTANTPYADLISGSRFKVRNLNLPFSWKNLSISDFNVRFIGDGVSAVTVRNIFTNNSKVSMQDVDIQNLNFEAINASGTGNIPDIADASFITAAKLENVRIEKVKLLPYASYGQSLSVIRAYNNVVVRGLKALITNLDGSYNPTTINFFEVRTGDARTDTNLLNEDYLNILFDHCDIKGFTDIILFWRGKATITDAQLARNRFTNNSINNSAFNSNTFTFMKDSGGSAVNQIALKQLNSVNDISDSASWTTAGRPTVRYVGMYGLNTTLNKTEWWNGTQWQDAMGTAT